jgi:predicted O-methyltransferase YrrM
MYFEVILARATLFFVVDDTTGRYAETSPGSNSGMAYSCPLGKLGHSFGLDFSSNFSQPPELSVTNLPIRGIFNSGKRTMDHDKWTPDETSQDKWTAVDRYFSEQLSLSDPALDAALAANAAANLPAIDVAPNQGKFLQLLALLVGARNILEIGTLGGYSSIWLARALPAGGRLITLEFNSKHAEVARANIARAGLADIVDIRVGAALDTLPKLQTEITEPFDLIFIDADKPNNAEYLRWALKLSRRGTLIIVDNVVRDGAVVDAASSNPDVQGARLLFKQLTALPSLSATALQTVGTKGHDGFALALVTAG